MAYTGQRDGGSAPSRLSGALLTTQRPLRLVSLPLTTRHPPGNRHPHRSMTPPPSFTTWCLLTTWCQHPPGCLTFFRPFEALLDARRHTSSSWPLGVPIPFARQRHPRGCHPSGHPSLSRQDTEGLLAARRTPNSQESAERRGQHRAARRALDGQEGAEQPGRH